MIEEGREDVVDKREKGREEKMWVGLRYCIYSADFEFNIVYNDTRIKEYMRVWVLSKVCITHQCLPTSASIVALEVQISPTLTHLQPATPTQDNTSIGSYNLSIALALGPCPDDCRLRAKTRGVRRRRMRRKKNLARIRMRILFRQGIVVCIILIRPSLHSPKYSGHATNKTLCSFPRRHSLRLEPLRRPTLPANVRMLEKPNARFGNGRKHKSRISSSRIEN